MLTSSDAKTDLIANDNGTIHFLGIHQYSTDHTIMIIEHQKSTHILEHRVHCQKKPPLIATRMARCTAPKPDYAEHSGPEPVIKTRYGASSPQCNSR